VIGKPNATTQRIGYQTIESSICSLKQLIVAVSLPRVHELLDRRIVETLLRDGGVSDNLCTLQT
jgi:hypothetical protein